MGALPEGEPAPTDGALPRSTNSLSFYLHIPFCARRCGYCDFNTYTAEELTRDGVVVTHSSYAEAVASEISLARKVLGSAEIAIPTIFIGGGTPSLVDPALIAKTIKRIRDSFTLGPDCEITLEANPDSVSEVALATWREAGVNRLSLGMQSAVPHVLEVLDRTHNPANVASAVAMARRAGFEQVSIDLIYGSPGESLADWEQSLDAALGLDPNHISAYALIVEEGTRLATQVRRGELIVPDDDETAEKYEVADQKLEAAGLRWYEISNWAKPGAQCRHNLAYWSSLDWWGIGPGAHSHVQGVRWWNVKHPAAYASNLARGVSPAMAREVLDQDVQRFERILLQLRLREGLPESALSPEGVSAAKQWVDKGDLVMESGRLVLTRSGRLLADAITRSITS